MLAEHQIFDFCLKYFNDAHMPADLATITLRNVVGRFESMSYRDALFRMPLDETLEPKEVKGTVEDLKQALSEMEDTPIVQ